MTAAGPMLDGRRVVVVGGGVVGLSIAHHLALRGYPDVTVVERGLLGSGTSSAGVGGIRQQFSSEVNIALGVAAVCYFEEFEERVGEPLDFRQHGYLFLLDNLAQRSVFEADVARQRALGAPAGVLEPDEISSVMPVVDTAGLVGAAYCPTDGSTVPAHVVHAFARQARRRGVDIRQHTTVTGIDRDADGAVCAVQTPVGRIEAGTVIDAAGPQAREVGRLVDVDVPVLPHSRQAFTVGPSPWMDPAHPLTVDFGSGAYLHPQVYGAVVGGNDRAVPSTTTASVDWDRVDAMLAALARRMPTMTGATITSGWAGLREMTPDDHGIVGPVAAVPGFWMAAGFSGKGFQWAPVIGDEVSRWLVEGAPGMDLSALRLERFAGVVEHETTVF